MKYTYKIVYLLLCLLLFSCGTAKKASKSKINELTLIKNAHEQGNTIFLIEALNRYPAYRGYTETYIYDNDYSKTDYGRLKEYANAAKNDYEVSIFFDSLLINKQTFIIDSLSQLRIADVGAFYKSNYIIHDYLKEVIRKAYFSDVPSLDYKNRKLLYTAFRDTDLCYEIDKPYHDLRDSLLSDIMGVLDPYFNTERTILKQIETAVRYESQQYVEAGLEKIIIAANAKNERGFFKKIFQSKDIDRYSFNEYVNKAINDTYEYSYIENLTKGRLSEYLASSKNMRSMLFKQYFNDSDYQKYIYIPESIIEEQQLIWVIGRKDVANIQSIKDMGTALTIGSFALSFVPGIGPVAFVADAADFFYGLKQDERINRAIEQLADTIYNDSLSCIGDYLEHLFGDLIKAQAITENNIRNIFNDEF